MQMAERRPGRGVRVTESSKRENKQAQQGKAGGISGEASRVLLTGMPTVLRLSEFKSCF